jgi:vancomycin permeability regulator SanA
VLGADRPGGGAEGVDEAQAMKRYLMGKGVPALAIVVGHVHARFGEW